MKVISRESRLFRCGDFIGTVYCDIGHVREPFNDTLVHVIDDGRQQSFEVSEMFERSSKPPKGLTIGIGSNNPPPPKLQGRVGCTSLLRGVLECGADHGLDSGVVWQRASL